VALLPAAINDVAELVRSKPRKSSQRRSDISVAPTLGETQATGRKSRQSGGPQTNKNISLGKEAAEDCTSTGERRQKDGVAPTQEEAMDDTLDNRDEDKVHASFPVDESPSADNESSSTNPADNAPDGPLLSQKPPQKRLLGGPKNGFKASIMILVVILFVVAAKELTLNCRTTPTWNTKGSTRMELGLFLVTCLKLARAGKMQSLSCSFA